MAIKDLFRKKVDPNTLAQQSTGGMTITFNRLPDHYCADSAKMTAITDVSTMATSFSLPSTQIPMRLPIPSRAA